ncbi:hypothetical protein E2C01_090569 [Portunus trituberculatus]|uniref:Uncharacterized protein n=1 Tax=Portunus trituberculatus TaxID=210409 RepID=A0A5B7JGX5_PORTR|nr:hypothetical protein [Portunus trituberculatus]
MTKTKGKRRGGREEKRVCVCVPSPSKYSRLIYSPPSTKLPLSLPTHSQQPYLSKTLQASHEKPEQHKGSGRERGRVRQCKRGQGSNGGREAERGECRRRLEEGGSITKARVEAGRRLRGACFKALLGGWVVENVTSIFNKLTHLFGPNNNGQADWTLMQPYVI